MTSRLDRTLYYCPKCLELREKGKELCAYCGERCRFGGFCPICNVSLMQPIGAFCPKHDVELVDLNDCDDDTLALKDPELVMLRSFTDAAEADAARLRLEAEGIPTFLDSERMGSQSFYLVATGGVKLLVPRSLEAEARVLLSQVWSLPKTEEIATEEEWDELGPEPGAWRRSVMKAAILLMLFGPLVVVGCATLAHWLGLGRR